MKCCACDGKKGWREYYDVGYVTEWKECPYCNGTGKATLTQWFWENVPVWFVELWADLFYKRDMKKRQEEE